MKYLYSHLPKLKTSLKNKFLFLFLDFDGTLAPIAEKPQDAHIPEQTKKVLVDLSKNPLCCLAIISGRSLKDIKQLVGVKKIIYVGNHGFEVGGLKIMFQPPIPPAYKSTLRQIKNKLHKRLSSLNGVILEDKGFSLAMHFRMVVPKNIPLVKSVFDVVTSPYLAENKISIGKGKQVIEVRPPVLWNKGTVVTWLLKKHLAINPKTRVLPIYIGDDVTDEDAFDALKTSGLTIRVGKSTKSSAKYYLKNTDEVLAFLKNLR
jgi:trehalose-phosphatase